MLDTIDGSTCLSYGPIAETCRQPLTILYTHSSNADCDKGSSLAHLNRHIIKLIEEEFVCITGAEAVSDIFVTGIKFATISIKQQVFNKVKILLHILILHFLI